MSGCLRARAACFDSWATIGPGVPWGAHRPYQVLMLKPGRPDSATVGTSGKAEERLAVVTAMARSLPDLMNGIAEGIESNISWICPPIRSVKAGALPLYGTCCMATLAASLKDSPARCCEEALPGDPKFKRSRPDLAS